MRYQFDNFIGLFEDVITPDQCDMIINYYENTCRLGLSGTRQEIEGANMHKTFKDDTTVFHDLTMPHEMVLTHYTHLPVILEAVKYCYSLYSKEYDILANNQLANSPGFRIQKTRPGQGYHVWHYETSKVENGARALAWTIYLNDVDEGGETEFLYQKKRIYPKKGSVVIWPAAFTHTHRGNPPLSGDKYIMTSWIQHTQ